MNFPQTNRLDYPYLMRQEALEQWRIELSASISYVMPRVHAIGCCPERVRARRVRVIRVVEKV
jgi:DNA polymerase III alpha subunit (gram-positive type)